MAVRVRVVRLRLARVVNDRRAEQTNVCAEGGFSGLGEREGTARRDAFGCKIVCGKVVIEGAWRGGGRVR